MTSVTGIPVQKTLRLATLGLALGLALPAAAIAQSIQFPQAVAEAAGKDRDVAEFYRATGYQALWTDNSREDRRRREALLTAIAQADDQGLPARRYNLDKVEAMLRSVRDDRARGQAEVALTRLFLEYARDVQSGILTPSRVDEDIKRDAPLRDRTALLTTFAKSSPDAYMRSLPPQTPEYARLMKEKMRLEQLLGRGGWGETVRASKLEAGATGGEVVALRNRLIRMDYLPRTASAVYDGKMVAAVQAFQADHGLATDGVAGPGTLKEINQPVEARLASVIVAMERERWTNMPRGDRHIWVNLTDFHVRVIDHGKVTFITRSVVGQNRKDQRSPEFSDVMEHMIVNPSWYVPRSITTKEYLPMLQQDPYAVRQLQLIGPDGRVYSREGLDFRMWDASTFPFDLKEPPGDANALGQVKFMFPNRWNIYLHDTPQKALFGRESRAYSHGCIRLQDPKGFAHFLLAPQSSDPDGLFANALAQRNEQQINLKQRVPVHLVYRTAFTEAKGKVQYRRDVYGRDGRIFSALQDAGVVLRSVQG